ncbi:Crp/Fnr family transcriptional regulator [Listeria monocytogenes]|nr:Crp/Fnr family transcriptional regulator [Listeria monocytogenes]EKA2555527.1 Crp/Fnr family transcriptional regulator [Listeria monocytogenes]EKA2558685.1 Crp/Fnr family transcriptional regulator [Listeria monocytogenes]EKA2561808.1 Crp/Fnr family transcriptional regulator [Listeria monocytogenes]EKA2564976.1 Crp/Fnr family transcriptional regulator [Listeria monocytogenes]
MNQLMLRNIERSEATYYNNQFKTYLLNDSTYPIVYERLYYEANKYVIEENKLLVDIFIIESGVVIENREQSISDFLSASELIGFEGLSYPNKTSSTSVMTLTKTVVYKISLQSVKEKLAKRPNGYDILNEIFIQKISNLTKRLTDTKSNYDKTLHTLENLASLYGQEKNGAIYMKKFFTKKMIANYLHVSYVTVVTICKRLVLEGILHDEPHGMILYPDKICNKKEK